MQNWLSVHKIQSRLKLSKALELTSKTTLKNLSFETNLESVAQSVEEWEQFKEKQFNQYLYNFPKFLILQNLINSGISIRVIIFMQKILENIQQKTANSHLPGAFFRI